MSACMDLHLGRGTLRQCSNLDYHTRFVDSPVLNPTVLPLCSAGNGIEVDGCKALAEALKVNTSVTSVDVRSMLLCMTGEWCSMRVLLWT